MAQATQADMAKVLKLVLEQEFPGHNFEFTPLLYDPQSFAPMSGLIIDRAKSKIRFCLGDLDRMTLSGETGLLEALCNEVERHFRDKGIQYRRRRMGYNLVIGSNVELR